MTSSQTPTTFAAAVYTPETGDRMALLKFVESQKEQGVRVGGVLQEAIFDAAGEISGLNAIDVSTGRRIPLSRPVNNRDACGLDVSALAQTAPILVEAINNHADLVVVEKFGELEQSGQGLIEEVLQTIAEGIPLLISVPRAALPVWQERSGQLGAVLPFDESAFLRWWLEIARTPAMVRHD